MNVEKKNMVTIPSHTYLDYYRIKNKYMTNHKCPKCGKKSSMVFKVENRILSTLCSSCKFHIRIVEDTYITYDEHATRSKQAYENSIDAILRAKFDLLFDYHSSSNIEHLRNKYLEQKFDYDQLYMQWEQSDPNHPQLKKDRDELIAKIKVHNVPEIHTQLNEVLDQLHKLEYTTQYNEVVPTPVYDLEIRTLDGPKKVKRKAEIKKKRPEIPKMEIVHEDMDDVIELNELLFYELYTEEFKDRKKKMTKEDYERWAWSYDYDNGKDTYSTWKRTSEKEIESFYTYLKQQGKYDRWIRENYAHCVKNQWDEIHN